MAEHKARLLPAIVMFVVVAGGVYIAGRIATSLLKTVVLPVAAILMGYGAARFVYRTRD